MQPPGRAACLPRARGVPQLMGRWDASPVGRSFVLIHSPLVGTESWAAVAAALARRGHGVQVADLTGSLALGPPYLPRMVEAVSTLASGPAILAGHSAAGPLLPALGRAVRGPEAYLFVDARLPHPGRSWMHTAAPEHVDHLRAMESAGWLPPWPQWWGAGELAELLPDPGVRDRFVAGCPRLPIPLFEEERPRWPGWPDAPCAYLRLSDGYEGPAEEARGLGWPLVEMPSHHLGLATDPEPVTDAILELVGQLMPRGPGRDELGRMPASPPSTPPVAHPGMGHVCEPALTGLWARAEPWGR